MKNEQDEAAETHHHRLVDEIANRVEERIAAKFVHWMVGNILAFVLAVLAGVGAFYDLKNDVRKSLERDIAQDSDMERMRDDTLARRQALDAKLDSISNRIDEINRFLRDHNSMTMNGFKAR